jgi:hypothetical protein
VIAAGTAVAVAVVGAAVAADVEATVVVAGEAAIAAVTADATARFFSVRFLPNLVGRKIRAHRMGAEYFCAEQSHLSAFMR